MTDTKQRPISSSVRKMFEAVTPLVSSQRQAELIIEAVCDALYQGGQAVYVPSGKTIRRYWRDEAIRAQFTGRNHQELGRKRGISCRQVRRIIDT